MTFIYKNKVEGKNHEKRKNLQLVRFELHFYIRNMYYFNLTVVDIN